MLASITAASTGAATGAVRPSAQRPAASSSSSSTLTYVREGSYDTGFGAFRQGAGNDALVNSLLFSNLVKVAPNEHTILPDLATSWTVSKNAVVYTFNLRKGVKWTDGEPFTAADVVFTASKACEWPSTSYLGYQPVLWRYIAGCGAVSGTNNVPSGIQQVNNYEVRFTLSQADSAWIRGLTDATYAIMPKHLLLNATASNIFTLPFTVSNPVGTGPYTLYKIVPNQYYEFKANPHYFMGKPKIRTIIDLLNLDDASVVADVESGSVQLAMDLDPTDAPSLKHLKNFKSEFAAGVGAELLEFKMDNPLVSNPLVRQAIVYAIDRKAILKAVAKGHGILRWVIPGFDQNAKALNQYAYDPAKAKQLLQQAHFNFSAPFPIPYAPTVDPFWNAEVPIIQSELQAVGINAQPEPLSSAAWVADAANPDPDFPMYLNAGGSFGLGPYESAAYYQCATPNASIGMYKNCGLTKFYDEYYGATSVKARAKYAGDIAKILNSQIAGLFPMWQQEILDAVSNKLQGPVTMFANDRDSFFNIWQWSLK